MAELGFAAGDAVTFTVVGETGPKNSTVSSKEELGRGWKLTFVLAVLACFLFTGLQLRRRHSRFQLRLCCPRLHLPQHRLQPPDSRLVFFLLQALLGLEGELSPLSPLSPRGWNLS